MYAAWRLQPQNAISICFQYVTGEQVRGFEIDNSNILEGLHYLQKEARKYHYRTKIFENKSTPWVLEQLKYGYVPLIVYGERPTLCVVIGLKDKKGDLVDFEPYYELRCLVPRKHMEGDEEIRSTNIEVLRFYQSDRLMGILITRVPD